MYIFPACRKIGLYESPQLHKTVWSVSLESPDERLARKTVLYLRTHTPTHTYPMFDFEKLTVYQKRKFIIKRSISSL